MWVSCSLYDPRKVNCYAKEPSGDVIDNNNRIVHVSYFYNGILLYAAQAYIKEKPRNNPGLVSHVSKTAVQDFVIQKTALFWIVGQEPDGEHQRCRIVIPFRKMIRTDQPIVDVQRNEYSDINHGAVQTVRKRLRMDGADITLAWLVVDIDDEHLSLIAVYDDRRIRRRMHDAKIFGDRLHESGGFDYLDTRCQTCLAW